MLSFCQCLFVTSLVIVLHSYLYTNFMLCTILSFSVDLSSLNQRNKYKAGPWSPSIFNKSHLDYLYLIYLVFKNSFEFFFINIYIFINLQVVFINLYIILTNYTFGGSFFFINSFIFYKLVYIMKYIYIYIYLETIFNNNFIIWLFLIIV